MSTTRENVLGWRGRTLVDTAGDKIGTLEEIYLDAQTDEPEWGVVTTGLFGSKQSFVPLADATSTDDGVRVPYEKATVKDAPKVDPDGRLSRSEERELYAHYGREYTEYDAPNDTGVLDRGDTSRDATSGRDDGDERG